VYAVGLRRAAVFRTSRSKAVSSSLWLRSGSWPRHYHRLLARLMGLSFALAAGLFTGALTSTPSLPARSTRSAGRSKSNSLASVGYVSVPGQLVGVALLIQFLPKLLGQTIQQADNDWLAARPASGLSW